jgi:hypothetical protein
MWTYFSSSDTSFADSTPCTLRISKPSLLVWFPVTIWTASNLTFPKIGPDFLSRILPLIHLRLQKHSVVTRRHEAMKSSMPFSCLQIKIRIRNSTYLFEPSIRVTATPTIRSRIRKMYCPIVGSLGIATVPKKVVSYEISWRGWPLAVGAIARPDLIPRRRPESA